jgi:hypothetical protein
MLGSNPVTFGNSGLEIASLRLPAGSYCLDTNIVILSNEIDRTRTGF